MALLGQKKNYIKIEGIQLGKNPPNDQGPIFNGIKNWKQEKQMSQEFNLKNERGRREKRFQIKRHATPNEQL